MVVWFIYVVDAAKYCLLYLVDSFLLCCLVVYLLLVFLDSCTHSCVMVVVCSFVVYCIYGYWLVCVVLHVLCCCCVYVLDLMYS